MLEFLIFASFIIHAITLTALYMLLKHVNSRNNSHANEMDSVMATYVEQIRQENNQLQAALRTHTPMNETNQEHQLVRTSEPDSSNEEDQPTDDSGEWNEEGISLKSGEDTVETTLESRVLQLHHAGLPIDMIAKQLHCGKTEASLIIQFQHKK